MFFTSGRGLTPLDIFKGTSGNFQPCLWRPKQVFYAKTWSFPSPHQMVCMFKPNQTISKSLSTKIVVATEEKFQHIQGLQKHLFFRLVCVLMSGALMGTHQAAVAKVVICCAVLLLVVFERYLICCHVGQIDIVSQWPPKLSHMILKWKCIIVIVFWAASSVVRLWHWIVSWTQEELVNKM